MNWKDSPAFQEIINDRLYIGRSVDDLDNEIQNNLWLISLDENERKQLGDGDIVEFIETIIGNRQSQLDNSAVEHGLYFYIWHDKQASQLRFCLISDLHDLLPFEATVITTPLIDIIQSFLHSTYTFTWGNLDVDDIKQEDISALNNNSFVHVYKRHLRKQLSPQ